MEVVNITLCCCKQACKSHRNQIFPQSPALWFYTLLAVLPSESVQSGLDPCPERYCSLSLLLEVPAQQVQQDCVICRPLNLTPSSTRLHLV